MTAPLFLDVPQLASALGVRVSTVYAWTQQTGPDSIPRVRLGKRYGFDLQDVVRWLKEYHDPRQVIRPPSSARLRRLAPARQQRTPIKSIGSRRGATPTTTRVSANGPAAVAFGVPEPQPADRDLTASQTPENCSETGDLAASSPFHTAAREDQP